MVRPAETGGAHRCLRGETSGHHLASWWRGLAWSDGPWHDHDPDEDLAPDREPPAPAEIGSPVDATVALWNVALLPSPNATDVVMGNAELLRDDQADGALLGRPATSRSFRSKEGGQG
ncbi:hypothetical protein GCM10010394_47360 [Streptomyces crystallinus]|uniref:Uncharacterized protein n=1 Tax=Streptomyces crystallinus TaxID=68191 RepID=A0ABP3RKD5_9ACTN